MRPEDPDRAACEVCGSVHMRTALDRRLSAEVPMRELMRCYGCGTVVCPDHDHAGPSALLATGSTMHPREAHWVERSPAERTALFGLLVERVAWAQAHPGALRAALPGRLN